MFIRILDTVFFFFSLFLSLTYALYVGCISGLCGLKDTAGVSSFCCTQTRWYQHSDSICWKPNLREDLMVRIFQSNSTAIKKKAYLQRQEDIWLANERLIAFRFLDKYSRQLSSFSNQNALSYLLG